MVHFQCPYSGHILNISRIASETKLSSYYLEMDVPCLVKPVLAVNQDQHSYKIGSEIYIHFVLKLVP